MRVIYVAITICDICDGLRIFSHLGFLVPHGAYVSQAVCVNLFIGKVVELSHPDRGLG